MNSELFDEIHFRPVLALLNVAAQFCGLPEGYIPRRAVAGVLRYPQQHDVAARVRPIGYGVTRHILARGCRPWLDPGRRAAPRSNSAMMRADTSAYKSRFMLVAPLNTAVIGRISAGAGGLTNGRSNWTRPWPQVVDYGLLLLIVLRNALRRAITPLFPEIIQGRLSNPKGGWTPAPHGQAPTPGGHR